MAEAIINDVAREMLAAMCADGGRCLAPSSTRKHPTKPGKWLVEIEPEVLGILVGMAPADISDAILECVAQAATRATKPPR
jgi:hypothetical protein